MLISLFQKHPQWHQIQEIDQTLRKAGFQSVLAGGCVRDALLGKIAKDIDIATDATPEQVTLLFSKVLMVGESFGVCRVFGSSGEGLLPVEVATFREESDYKDGRRPQKVMYSSLDKDAQRRDFTINAMYFDLLDNKVIDTVGGAQDLKQRILRTVGEPRERFAEDSLRLLRACRFAAQMNLKIEDNTRLAIIERSHEIHRVSQERIQDEINKAFQIEEPFLFFQWLKQLSLQKEIFRDWTWSEDDLRDYYSQAVDSMEGWAGLALLQLDDDEFKVVERLKKFKISNETVYFVQSCLGLKSFFKKNQNSDLQNFVSLMKRKGIQKAAQCSVRAFKKKAPEGLALWQSFSAKYCPLGELPEGLVKGEDLLKLGLQSGPELGRTLQEIYLLQLQNPSWDASKLLKTIQHK